VATAWVNFVLAFAVAAYENVTAREYEVALVNKYCRWRKTK